MKKTILVVDDEAMILKIVESRLMANGYNVLTADNGEAAIELAVSNKPDLIILDVMMPKMDGPTVAEKLKENSVTANIPVIFLTALVKKSEEKAQKHIIGGNYFIAKPFEANELLATIERLLS